MVSLDSGHFKILKHCNGKNEKYPKLVLYIDMAFPLSACECVNVFIYYIGTYTELLELEFVLSYMMNVILVLKYYYIISYKNVFIRWFY